MSYQTRNLAETDIEALKPRILELFHANGMPDAEIRFEWLYRSDYARNHLCSRVLFHNDRLVGIISMLPVPAGKRVIASMANLLVDERHRTLGPALILMKSLIADSCAQLSPDLIIGRPNRKADILLKRLRFQSLGQAIRQTWVANPVAFMPLPSSLKSFGGRLLSPLMRTGLWVQERSAAVRQGRIGTPDWRRIDDPKQIRHRLPPYLYWRYFEIPNGNSRLAVPTSSDLNQAYLIYSVSPQGTLYISDFEPEDNAAAQPLLARFMRQMLKRMPLRNFSICCLNSPSLSSALDSLGFIERIDGDELTVYLGSCDGDNRTACAQLPVDLPLFPSRFDF